MEWLIRSRRMGVTAPAARGDDGGPLLSAVAEGCDLATLQQLWATWVQEKRPPRGFEVSPRLDLVVAAAAGSLTPDWAAKVEWLVESCGCPLTALATARAAAAGDAGTPARLAWLRARGAPVDESAARAAAWAGDIATLSYLLVEGGAPRPDVTAASGAARGGHLAVMVLLHEHGCDIHAREAAETAARAGHLHVVAWLVQELLGGDARRLGPNVVTAAAGSGSVELLAWLRARGCPWGVRTFAAAAEGGCEEALEWLVAQCCPMGEGCFMSYVHAANYGDLATLRCLRRLGVPWGPPGEVFARAVRFAPLPVLLWLEEQADGSGGGCCSVDMFEAAASAKWRGGAEGAQSAAAARHKERPKQLIAPNGVFVVTHG
ncbi:hypothetical protein GPECTOR_27g620 [Gonium pectorale]|uniref:Ankyrin repeat domain-containing protein n=1 Tax=Gonium pectorale TaxID=33097 RepID=A0A150GGH9_GONPE|nr:hypothetical protein GPECTOR_27g620 [Gonium pectorale]|eukprot:KXZ48450.1 hypothetical protein GPECTOR_27g620 [Gonium pectorale]